MGNRAGGSDLGEGNHLFWTMLGGCRKAPELSSVSLLGLPGWSFSHTAPTRPWQLDLAKNAKFWKPENPIAYRSGYSLRQASGQRWDPVALSPIQKVLLYGFQAHLLKFKGMISPLSLSSQETGLGGCPLPLEVVHVGLCSLSSSRAPCPIEIKFKPPRESSIF